MMRYNAGDETLTDEDYHYLYYGYGPPGELQTDGGEAPTWTSC